MERIPAQREILQKARDIEAAREATLKAALKAEEAKKRKHQNLKHQPRKQLLRRLPPRKQLLKHQPRNRPPRRLQLRKQLLNLALNNSV